jgi:hypothetical protein
MAKIYQEQCQLFIEQEIDKALAEGRPAYSVGKEIAAWVEKTFGRAVKFRTVQQAMLRKEKALQCNVPAEPEPTPEDDSEKKEIQVDHGGAREGAGRPIGSKLPKLGPPRNGMQFARIAIMKLEEIRDEDLEREEAFDHVQAWLNKKRGGGKKR